MRDELGAGFATRPDDPCGNDLWASWVHDEVTCLSRRSTLRGLTAPMLWFGCGPTTAGSAETSAPSPGKARAQRPIGSDSAPLRILVLGGTGFLGPHVVEYAMARGHMMTLFNRGKTNPHLFADVEKLVGDRDGKLDALRGRKWDAVIDTSGYVPRIVQSAAELLADAAEHYLFVSTISVYADFSRPGIDESAPVAMVEDERSEDVGQFYGALKALCERTVTDVFAGRVTHVRPGLIVGPGDPTDRFTYWPVRVERGGRLLAPGDGLDPVQFIDARDLARFMVEVLENRVSGTYNACCPSDLVTMDVLLRTCVAVADGDAQPVWVPADFLERHGAMPWSDLPVWVPRASDSAGLAQVDANRAVAKGLRFRAVADTIRDTLAWVHQLPHERIGKLRAGLTVEREAAILAAWDNRGDRSKRARSP